MAAKELLLAALVGVIHVHHAPSHDSDAPFEAVLDAAWHTGVDFLVLTEHAADSEQSAPLPAAERAGIHRSPDGRELLVMVGAEFGSSDGHVLGLQIRRTVPSLQRRGGQVLQRSGAQVIRAIHAQGGFAVIPHPFTHGGWHDWEADFDGLEVQNTASDFAKLYGPLLPLRLLRHRIFRRASLRRLWVRPDRELEKWESLLVAGRRPVAFSGADAHRNVSLLGWQLDPYEQAFAGVRTVCPGNDLDPSAIWKDLRAGRCYIHYAVHEPQRAVAVEHRLPSGRVELRIDDGRRILEIRNPETPGYTADP
ncbi:MAG: hypothetical protein GY725_25540 [bacterium]|nr:hypothetical protein [bacterium]